MKDQESYRKNLAVTQEYLRPDWRVLEFGCGTDSTAITHAPHVGQILVIDISGEMLAIAEVKPHWRLLIPLMQSLGLAPYVSRLGKPQLVAMLSQAGFVIDYEWQPKRASLFLVAGKPESA